MKQSLNAHQTKKGKTAPYSIVNKHIPNKMETKKGMYFQHNENKMMNNLKSTEPNSILINSINSKRVNYV
jgi:hypothetical protein